MEIIVNPNVPTLITTGCILIYDSQYAGYLILSLPAFYSGASLNLLNSLPHLRHSFLSISAVMNIHTYQTYMENVCVMNAHITLIWKCL